MSPFNSPLDFERKLIQASNLILENYARTFSNVNFLTDSSPSYELDYVFKANPPYDDGRIFIFEFKYSSSPTLTDSLAFTILARFDALRNANPQSRFEMVLVTNGHVRDAARDFDGLKILSDITDIETWKKKLKAWLRKEIPNFPA